MIKGICESVLNRVYDFCDMTDEELRCKFFQKLQECIELCNNTNEIVEWIKNEGLEKEVNELLSQWLEDGTLEKLINIDILNKKVDNDVFNNEIENIRTDINEKAEELTTNLTEKTEELTTNLNEKTETIITKINNYFVLAPKPSGNDDTTILQHLIESGKTIVFPYGSIYKVNSLSINNVSKLKIIGNGAKFTKSNGEGAIISLNNSNYITIEGLEFEYSILPSSSSNEHCCLSIDNYSYININSCIFNNFKEVAINLKSAKDTFDINNGTTSTPCLIENCKFLNQTNITHFATSILLGADSEYCKILYNEFRNVWTAIRGYGANSLISGNTVMDCKATFSNDSALIYLEASEHTNSAKHIISNNELNHNEKGVTAIYCIGDKSRNERRYTIVNNHILVQGLDNSNNGYAIAIKNGDYSLIHGNYCKVKPANKGNILLENSVEVNVSANTLQQATGIRATNSTFYEANNLFQDCERKVWCLDNSFVLGKTYIARIKHDTAELGIESNIENATAQRTSEGVYVLTHNLGHIQYVATAMADATTSPTIIVITRTANTLEIRCFTHDGQPRDVSTMVMLTTK